MNEAQKSPETAKVQETAKVKESRVGADEISTAVILKKSVRAKIDILASSQELTTQEFLTKHLTELASKVSVTVNK
jgi:hypothetical protein